MFSSPASIANLINDFQVYDRMLRYNLFAPKLFNFCLSLGLEPGKIMPSRAFCSDESQGYPIILITKHFGAFPFNHGRVGGIVSTDRHGPHAEHGKDMVIIQASHVGYDPDTQRFGTYRRLNTDGLEITPSCGKIDSVVQYYLNEYRFAAENIYLERINGEVTVTIDNQLLPDHEKGLYIIPEMLVRPDAKGEITPYKVRVTGKSFTASKELITRLGENAWPEVGREKIGNRLMADMFRFKRHSGLAEPDQEGKHHLEANLFSTMPWIVTSEAPLLTAAKINSQVEFDRVFRSIVQEPSYRGKRILLLSGLHIDISPRQGELFPLTKFIPWAAYFQDTDGSQRIFEQEALFDALDEQSAENPHRIDLEAAIEVSEKATAVEVAKVNEVAVSLTSI